MKKKTFLKSLSFTSLALLMGIAGTMAFVPLGSGPSVASANEMVESTTEQGLITPKADDPVIYTTESGLEIKWGNALPDTINGSLASGNLAGFPYFTTKNGSTTYTWVIIGRNSNVTAINTAVKSYLFSTWKTNDSTNTWKYSNSFFKDTYETTTPAGNAINNVVPSKSYVNDNISFSVSNITSNSEIPSGCVLCLSNLPLVSCAYYDISSSSNTYSPNPWDAFSDQEYTTGEQPTYCGPYIRCKNYTNDDSLGFGSLLTDLQYPSLIHRIYYNSSPQTSIETVTKLKFFPLGGSNYTEENFKWQTYLTATEYKTTQNVWCRGMYDKYSPYITDTNGSISYLSNARGTAYLRPACVLKIT